MIPPLVERRLREQFKQVPRETVTLYQWRSPEGEEFWDSVHRAVESGVDLEEIGETLGIVGIKTRYASRRGSK